MYKADLHVHSSNSSCSETIDEILEIAKEKSITHLSFTECNTIKGVEYAIRRGKTKGINIIPGVEITCYNNCISKKVNILGYNYKTTDNIRKVCNPMLNQRNYNSIKQVRILQDLGFNINIEYLRESFGEIILEEHILDYLYKTNQTNARYGDVYNELFIEKGICDFDINYIEPVEAIKAIVKDGGQAVLAHPGKENNLSLIFSLIEAGLKGIELNHYSNSEGDKKEIELICNTNKLFMTGGSDYKGDYSPINNEIGSSLAHESSRFIFLN